MFIEEKIELKIAEVWLTSDELESDDIQKILKEKYKEYAEKKFRVVVYNSGKHDILSVTEALILHNRK